MALRRFVAAFPRRRCRSPPIQVRSRRICLIIDSRVIDSYRDEDDDGDGSSGGTHALALPDTTAYAKKHNLIVRRSEPDEIAGFSLPKVPALAGMALPELLGSKTYRPTRRDNELVNDLCHLLEQGSVSPWELEDVVRSNGGVLMPYHVCEVLKHYTRDVELAYAFFKWADLHSGFQHDNFSCNAILKILGLHRRYDEIKRVMLGMEEQMIPMTYVTYRILLRIYVDASMVEDALETFHKMEFSEIKPTLDDYHYIMFKLIRLKCPRVVPMIFESMRKNLVRPNTQTYNFLISSLCSLGKMAEARWRFSYMKKYCDPDEFTYAALINGFCKCMDTEVTLELLEEMLARGLRPNLALFNMMMDAHSRSGKHEQVIALFERMVEHECRPDPKSYRVLVEAFAVSGRIDEAFGFVQRYADSENAPHLGAYNTLMNRLGKANKAHAALEIFYKIKDRPNYKPDLVTYNVLIDLLGKVGKIDECWSCYQKMRLHFQPDIFSYNTLLGRLGRAGRVDLFASVLDDMSRDGVQQDRITYAILVEGYARAGNLDVALAYLEEMKSSGFSPTPSALEVLVNSLLKAGRFGAAEAVVQEMAAINGGPGKKIVTGTLAA
ncbi:pentatricopeptide repeat-containing protein At1g09900 [Selaginella moellendorffii]|uniref:pentatricopeptide repeat-containing protein At1g09900 n=1 Tax=Selaginella moellendorffii TaxID=88036 RepID=UPI000D1C6089|nr:pentatricopeptide repeat-containing protein At1g09900 [Selaginella moellendorffii]|eukprot:XP_024545114.1 pentatricopeptide repeat-containing protein At1g09900 [Selaginella moellendorffii]